MSLAAARAQALAESAEEHFAKTPHKLWTPPAPGSTASVVPTNQKFYDNAADAWPDVPLPHKPLGNLILVQLRLQPMRGNGIVFDAGLQQTESDNTQVAKVVAIGPLAFRNRDTGELWPEGAWCQVGDYVRIPKYQGDRVGIEVRRTDRWYDEAAGKLVEDVVNERVIFIGLKDIQLLGRYETEQSALAARAWL